MKNQAGVPIEEYLPDIDQVVTDLTEAALAADTGEIFEQLGLTDHTNETASSLLRLAKFAGSVGCVESAMILQRSRRQGLEGCLEPGFDGWELSQSLRGALDEIERRLLSGGPDAAKRSNNSVASGVSDAREQDDRDSLLDGVWLPPDPKEKIGAVVAGLGDTAEAVARLADPDEYSIDFADALVASTVSAFSALNRLRSDDTVDVKTLNTAIRLVDVVIAAADAWSLDEPRHLKALNTLLRRVVNRMSHGDLLGAELPDHEASYRLMRGCDAELKRIVVHPSQEAASTARRELAVAEASQSKDQPWQRLVGTVVERLNEADRDTIQALSELWQSGETPATVESIATKAGRNPQATKVLTGAMHRFGILDRGANGIGYTLSDLGREVATKVGTAVGTD